jgi:hypothetical protein
MRGFENYKHIFLKTFGQKLYLSGLNVPKNQNRPLRGSKNTKNAFLAQKMTYKKGLRGISEATKEKVGRQTKNKDDEVSQSNKK